MTSLAIAALIYFGIVVVALKARLTYLRLPALPRRADGAHDITVVIPARNEAGNIQRVIRSFAGTPVIVVDDASTDGTAALAEAAGAKVIPAPPLEAGALGKPNACHAGAMAAPSDWLLFVDADTWYEPGFASRLVTYAEDEKLEMLSAFLRQHTCTFFERTILPYAFALYFAGVNAGNVNSSVSREALANGQCMLFRRDAYRRLGGHAAVSGSVIEDVALARLAKDVGIHSRVVRAEDGGNVRMYEGLASIWSGFEKNSFRFLLVNPISGLIVIFASIVFTTYLPVLALLFRDAHWLALGVFSAVPGVCLLPWYRGLHSLLLAPLGIYLFQLIALTAMLKTLTRRKSIWKGRKVG